MVGRGGPIFSISAAIMMEEGLERNNRELERALEVSTHNKKRIN